jgi:hypothetical protein
MAFVLAERDKKGRGSLYIPERLVTAIAYCGDGGMDCTLVEYFDEDGDHITARVAGKPSFIGLGE